MVVCAYARSEVATYDLPRKIRRWCGQERHIHNDLGTRKNSLTIAVVVDGETDNIYRAVLPGRSLCS